MGNTILVFGCDHHKDVQWKLPYIRFGGPESDCSIKCENKIFDIDVNADETPKLFWLWKNIDQFGCDYIGYCQYRRFFTKVKVNLPLVNIQEDQFNENYPMTPTEQLMVIDRGNFDGILHPAFNLIDKRKVQYKYIWDQIYIMEGERVFQMRYQKKAFDIFLQNTPDDLKENMLRSFEISENYLCNIFTTKKEIFKLFGQIAFNSVKQLLEIMTADEKKENHPYWLAYLFERYTNCFYHCLELSGKYKFAKVPLMTIDAGKHIKWEKSR